MCKQSVVFTNCIVIFVIHCTISVIIFVYIFVCLHFIFVSSYLLTLPMSNPFVKYVVNGIVLSHVAC